MSDSKEFLKRIWTKESQYFESWVSEILEFLRQIVLIAVSHAAFMFLHFIGVHGYFIDRLEHVHHFGALIVFGLFILKVVIGAGMHAWRSK